MQDSQTFTSTKGRVDAQFSEGTWFITIFDIQNNQVDQLRDNGIPTKDAVSTLLGKYGMSDVSSQVQIFVDQVSRRAHYGNGY